MQHLTQAATLIGARAVNFNPHFTYFVAPDDEDDIGSISSWPAQNCVLLLDSFRSSARKSEIQKAARHSGTVWILHMASSSEEATQDRSLLRSAKARLYAQLPKGSLVTHQPECWREGKYDVRPCTFPVQIWCLGAEPPDLNPASFSSKLGSWTKRREDFYLGDCLPGSHMATYREHQQDAIQSTWPGTVAATDGSVNYSSGIMGAGAVLGHQQPSATFSARVGGPPSTLRAEAAALDLLLQHVNPAEDLLIFCDSLSLLQIIQRWGSLDYWPCADDLLHFDVISTVLDKLRSRPGRTLLVKVKSHCGCMMNERADEAADFNGLDQTETLWPGPDKASWLRLSVRDSVRKRLSAVPTNTAPNSALTRKMIANVEREAAKLRKTIFSQTLLEDPVNAGPIARTVASASDATIRCWIKLMSGTYPTATYLHRIGRTESNICPHCDHRVPETPGHFACVCPKFHNARTVAHDLCWENVSSFIEKHSLLSWRFQWGKSMASSRLNLVPVRIPEDESGGSKLIDVRSLKPDGLAVNDTNKQILVLEFCRPSDSRPQQVQAAYYRKLMKYSCIKDALTLYEDQGWQISVLPWVVGIRGLVDLKGVEAAARALGIPRNLWAAAADCTALASIESFAYMHRIRYMQQGTLISATGRIEEAMKGLGRKPRTRRATRHAQEDAESRFRRWRLMQINTKGRRSASTYRAQLTTQIHTSVHGWPNEAGRASRNV